MIKLTKVIIATNLKRDNSEDQSYYGRHNDDYNTLIWDGATSPSLSMFRTRTQAHTFYSQPLSLQHTHAHSYTKDQQAHPSFQKTCTPELELVSITLPRNHTHSRTHPLVHAHTHALILLYTHTLIHSHALIPSSKIHSTTGNIFILVRIHQSRITQKVSNNTN